MPRRISLGFAALVAVLLSTLVAAVPPDAAKDPVAANTDAEKARAAIGLPDGLTAEVWAAEPLMANPVAFCFDEKGRAFVAETTRFDKGVPDTRGHMYWLDEDIGSRSVEDRLKMYAKHKYGAKDDGYQGYDDQVRLVWDSTGKGRADKSTVFSKGYNQLKDGLGAGVLARKGSVYYTNIPDVYKLTDTKGTGEADKRESLATGFGVRAQFIGHDLHGLRMGPDGKLYFSIGDRGFNVTTVDGKKLVNTDSGAVLRCDPDGKNMEIVHTGLRNPQELAFDDHGNLFTYDNNCDSGDRARWVQIVEGGDSGWRCGYQYGTLMHTAAVPQGNRGPWNTEKIWHVPGPDGSPPAYVVPPLKHFGNGPSGITHYPGVGLNDKYKDHFFACDFTANPGGSKIWEVSVKPKGASFEVTEKEFVRNMVPTDCEFGPDGAFYFSDWVGGWNPPGKGRIFRVVDAEAMKNPAVAEAKKLLAEGFEKRSVDELAKLLGHPHQQVRLEAQYELAGRKRDEAIPAFAKVERESKDRIARIHAIWGMGMCGAATWVSGRANDPDPEIRTQVLRTLALTQAMPEVRSTAMRDAMRLLADPEPRVKAAAAIAVGALARQPARVLEGVSDPTPQTGDVTVALLALLKSNADKDVYVRQAAVQGLVTMTRNPDDLLNAWKGAMKDYDTPAVRMGVVLALRRMECKKLNEFLGDGDPKIVAEAARAIHDQNLTEPMADLAKLSDTSGLEDAVQFRALSANFKLGGKEHAERLARFAARSNEPDHLRATALKLLADWPKPSKRDHITGCRQDLAERNPLVVVEAMKPVLAKIFVGSAVVRKEAAECAKKLGLSDAGPLLFATVTDTKQPVNLRVDSLIALDEIRAKELDAALRVMADSTEPKLRGAVRVINARKDPTAAEKDLPAVLKDDKAAVVEKQMALEAMGRLFASKDVDAALAEWLDEYLAGKVPDKLKLDVLEAAKARAEKTGLKLYAPLREKLKAIDTAARAAEAKDHLSRFRESLAGGDADRGRDLFLNNAAVYCQRCHKLDGQGGEVGPPLNGIAADKPRDYLLEAITHPSKQIAKGYESVQLTLLDGRTVSGVLKGKTKDEYTIATSDAKIVKVPAADVDFEKPDKSAMPDDLVKKLSKRELRDVVEFLASLREPAKK
jgi:quinoprotein glucose dehydrogenase